MLRNNWIRVVLVVILALIVLFFIRMHAASGQAMAQAPSVQGRIPQPRKADAESGRLYSQNWCTGCHSVQPETAGTGKFAPDFTVIAKRRSIRWLNSFLQSKHDLMPDFVLTRQETDDIVAYILSLKGG
jgi:mono/diheme cytochrome c family protein